MTGDGPRVVAEWTLNVTRGAPQQVDVTCFGDVTRTYLVAYDDTTADITGTTEDGEAVRIDLRPRWARRATAVTITDTTEIPATATTPTNTYDGFLRFDNNMWGTTLTTTDQIRFEATPNTNTIAGINGTIRFNHNMTAEQYRAIQEQVRGLTYQWDQFGLARARTPLTPAQERQRAADVRRMAASRAKHDAQRLKAHEKALKLLMMHLTEAQQKQVAARDSFQVQGENLLYTIALTGRVTTKKPYGDFCIAPYGVIRSHLPGPDQALALKLMIESDEAEFLRTGNWSGRYEKKAFALARLSIDGVPGNDGYTSRLYGQTPEEDERYRQRYGLGGGLTHTWNYLTTFDQT